jgi:hypothetical protein
MSDIKSAPLDGTDPSVKIPDAIKASGAKSEELHKQMYNAEAEVEVQAEEAPVETVASEEPQVKEPSENFSKNQPTKAPVTSDDNWEHRYNSMRGRFEREQGETRRLAGEIQNLHRLMAELQAAPRPAPSDVRFEKLVTPEEENDYGSEFLGVVGKKAKEELTPEIKALRAKIAELEGRVQGVTGAVVQDARAKMYEVLDTQVPNWRELNSNQDFLDWLNLPDAYSGAIRKQLLNAAYERSDASRVAAFFRGFISDEAVTNPAGYSQPAPVADNAGSKRVSLEKLAAPGRAKTAAASAPAEKPYFTRAQISAFYSEVNQGKYRGREEDKQRIENQIFSAQREGRIK